MSVWSKSSFSSIGKIVWHSSISIHCKSVQRAPSYQPEIMQRTEWSDDGRPDLSLYAGEFAKIWGICHVLPPRWTNFCHQVINFLSISFLLIQWFNESDMLMPVWKIAKLKKTLNRFEDQPKNKTTIKCEYTCTVNLIFYQSTYRYM